VPKLIAWLLGVLETRIGSIVVSALLSLGFSFVTYKFTAQPFLTMIRNYMSSGGQQFLQVMGFIGVDQCVTMVFSAIAMRYAVSGVSNLVRNKAAAPA